MKTYKFKINGNDYSVEINSVEGNVADVSVNGASYKVEMENAPAAAPAPVAAQAPAAPAPAAAPATAPAKAPQGEGTAVKPPMPGVILEVSVQVGDVVKKDQKVAVLEAMKMENEICAPMAGTVTAVLVNKGDSVSEDNVIVRIG